MRIGINGAIPQVGQAYMPLNTSITAANYTPQGEVLSNVGTVIGLESGPLTDVFFLQFDTLGGQSYPIVEPTPVTPPMPLGPVVADVGVRTFAQVNSTLAALTGVPVTQYDGERHLSERAAAAALGADSRGLLGRQPGRYGAARDSILQHHGQYPVAGGADVPGRDIQRHAVLESAGHQFRHQRARGEGARCRHGQPAGSVDRHDRTQ